MCLPGIAQVRNHCSGSKNMSVMLTWTVSLFHTVPFAVFKKAFGTPTARLTLCKNLGGEKDCKNLKQETFVIFVKFVFIL